MIQLTYNEQDVEKLNNATVSVVKALRGLEPNSDGQKVAGALQELQKTLNEFPSAILASSSYVRLTDALHVLTDMRLEEKWHEKLSLELAEIVDQFLKILFEAVQKHPIFKTVALPDLSFLQSRPILMRESDVAKQVDLFEEFDPYLDKALAQFDVMNEIADKKNTELADIAQQFQKAKFAVHGKVTEEQSEAAFHFMTEFYAICLAAAIASEVVTILQVYRKVVLKQISKKLEDLQKSVPNS